MDTITYGSRIAYINHIHKKHNNLPEVHDKIVDHMIEKLIDPTNRQLCEYISFPYTQPIKLYDTYKKILRDWSKIILLWLDKVLHPHRNYLRISPIK